ncbi:MAG: ferredoxin [Moorella sp. (in: firmicutes)]
MAVVNIDRDKCRPERCESGVCAATSSCTWKALEQSRPFVPPSVDTNSCLGCFRCTLFCPHQAISVL